jgi:hypothetical protein
LFEHHDDDDGALLLLKQDDWRRTVVQGPDPPTRKGPILTGAAYPDALVAKAFSHGDDLELVLYPGKEAGVRPITVERLRPDAAYSFPRNGETFPLTSDAKGSVTFGLPLNERTAFTIRPTQ